MSEWRHVQTSRLDTLYSESYDLSTARSLEHRATYGCSTVVLIGFTCPAITVVHEFGGVSPIVHVRRIMVG